MSQNELTAQRIILLNQGQRFMHNGKLCQNFFCNGEHDAESFLKSSFNGCWSCDNCVNCVLENKEAAQWDKAN